MWLSTWDLLCTISFNKRFDVVSLLIVLVKAQKNTCVQIIGGQENIALFLHSRTNGSVLFGIHTTTMSYYSMQSSKTAEKLKPAAIDIKKA